MTTVGELSDSLMSPRPKKKEDQAGSENETGSCSHPAPPDDTSTSMSSTPKSSVQEEANTEHVSPIQCLQIPSGEVNDTSGEASMETLLRQKKCLLQEAVHLHRRVAESLSDASVRMPTESKSDSTPSNEAATEKTYKAAIRDMLEVNRALDKQKREYGALASEMRTKVDTKEKRAKEISRTFLQFKREIAEGSVDRPTVKPKVLNTLEELEASETEKSKNIERERLKNIRIRMELKRLEKRLRAKETLAEGLSSIDFEALQIENKNLRTTSKCREEEFQSTKKKHAATVNTSMHVKEALRRAQEIDEHSSGVLTKLDNDIATANEQITELSRQRNLLLRKSGNRKDQTVSANKTLLANDYKQSSQKLRVMESHLSDLKTRHLQLVKRG